MELTKEIIESLGAKQGYSDEQFILEIDNAKIYLERSISNEGWNIFVDNCFVQSNATLEELLKEIYNKGKADGRQEMKLEIRENLK